MRIFTHAILFITLICFACKKDNESPAVEIPATNLTPEEQSVLSELNKSIFPIDDAPLMIADSELRVLNQLADKKIVGLGESTHGTKEFFQMKHRVFQYLVENHGFSAFLFEIDMGEARIFNDWVQWRRDEDIRELMLDYMLFWTWNTGEVQALLQYMRNYNQGKTEMELIGIYGVDTQFPIYDWVQLQEILAESEVAALDSLIPLNDSFEDLLDLYRNNLTDSIVGKINYGIDNTIQVVADNESLITEKLGATTFLWAKQLALHMEQVQQVAYDLYRNNRYHQRDRYMADNTAWFFELLGESTKVVLWAHNGHLANDRTYAGIYGGSQGSYLKDQFGSDYQIIGFSFAKGTFTAVTENGPLETQRINSEPLANTSTNLFYQAESPSFILPLHSNNSLLNEWFNQSSPFLMIGALFNGNPEDYYRPTKLRAEYDYLIHFDFTNNSELNRR